MNYFFFFQNLLPACVNSCVGCGRCVRSCPVNLDIRKVLERIAKSPNVTIEK
ncbi:MAG: 4Fe-4S binding protein [Planctomycetota bacterium]